MAHLASLAYCAAAPPPQPSFDPGFPRLETALARGLEFIAKGQQPSGNLHSSQDNRLAITSLGVMAFLANGHTPGDGRHGAAVRRAVDFVLKAVPQDGYVGRVDGSRMYGQGIVTMTLAEAYGVERDPERRELMRRALVQMVRVILSAQRVSKDAASKGGWRYEPASSDSDLSLLGWNALALRACNNIGISVPKESIQAAVDYTLRCYRPASKTFGYQPGGDRGAPAMTGVGVLTLCLLDASERPEVFAAAETLAEEKLGEVARFPYYSHYYAVHAAFQVGKKTWQTVWTTSSERLLALQQEDGGWPRSPTHEEPDRVYATAMSVLTLSVPLRLVPVIQR